MPQEGMSSDFSLNQFEYCYLVEDTPPDAKSMKIYIPKLMQNFDSNSKKEKSPVDTGIFLNQEKSQLNVSSNVGSQGYIDAPVQLEYAHEHKHHNCQGKVEYQDNCPNRSHPCSCPGSSTLATCPHFHHDHHFPHKDDYGMIPAGTRLICFFMDNNIKDVRVSRLICEFP